MNGSTNAEDGLGHGAVSEAIAAVHLGLFVWAWDGRDGEPMEVAERLGLIATVTEDGSYYMQ